MISTSSSGHSRINCSTLKLNRCKSPTLLMNSSELVQLHIVWKGSTKFQLFFDALSPINHRGPWRSSMTTRWKKIVRFHATVVKMRTVGCIVPFNALIMEIGILKPQLCAGCFSKVQFASFLRLSFFFQLTLNFCCVGPMAAHRQNQKHSAAIDFPVHNLPKGPPCGG